LVTARGGMSKLGCLFSLAFVAGVIYLGNAFGQIYWRFYEFQDEMRQEATFAAHRTDAQILKHLQAAADSLGLPDDAKAISVNRSATAIAIEADYDEHVQLPKYVREIHLHPHAEGTF
jgi:hypothetical protein